MPTEPHHIEDPEYLRVRAKNMRVLAAQTKHQSAKKILEDVAESYERLAALAENRLQKPENR